MDERLTRERERLLLMFAQLESTIAAMQQNLTALAGLQIIPPLTSTLSDKLDHRRWYARYDRTQQFAIPGIEGPHGAAASAAPDADRRGDPLRPAGGSRSCSAGNQAAAAAPLMRVLDIVGELLAGVRQTKSELNDKLAAVYWFIFRRVSEAKMHSDATALAEVLRLLEFERETWQKVCEKLSASGDSPAASSRRTRSPHAVRHVDDRHLAAKRDDALRACSPMPKHRSAWADVRRATCVISCGILSPHEDRIVTATKQLIRVGHSPDPDDAFMFYALANDRIDTGDYDSRTSWSTSRRSIAGRFKAKLELTAVSIHAYAFLHDKYVLCTCGASMGDGYGPMVVAREPMSRRASCAARRSPCRAS